MQQARVQQHRNIEVSPVKAVLLVADVFHGVPHGRLDRVRAHGRPADLASDNDAVRGCRFTLQCGTHVLLDFNTLAETEVSLEAFQLGLPEAF